MSLLMKDQCDLMSRSGLNLGLTLGINTATSVCKFIPVLFLERHVGRRLKTAKLASW